jgi:hypothetical protein
MKKSKAPRDPIGALQREAIAARRAGKNARCACGETRPEALVKENKPTRCVECTRKMKGQTAVDNHHVAGRANSPGAIAVPANDHKAVLSEAQYDWPRETLENPEGCPLLAAAGCIRGFIETLSYLIDTLLRWVAEMLEVTSAVLADRLGPQWWLDTPLAQFARKG